MSQAQAKGIIDRVKVEAEERIASPAIGRFDAELMGARKTVWLTNEPSGGQVRYVPGFHGGTSAVVTSRSRVLHQNGSTNVYKNTKLGELLILEQSGMHRFKADVGEREITILSKAIYQPLIPARDAINVKMFAGSSHSLEIPSLKEWLSKLTPAQPPSPKEEVAAESEQVEMTSEIEEETLEISLEKVADREEKELIRLIAEEETERKRQEEELERLIAEEEELNAQIREQEQRQELEPSKVEHAEFLAQLAEIEANRERKAKVRQQIQEIKAQRQQFIRTQQDLRTQHILDPVQEKVKRDNFFNDQYVVIEGGPGTGKTTTLIQRIKFLTSTSILEYCEDAGRPLSESQEKILFDDANSWIFISPSQLLRDYLKSAMSEEGLHHLEPSVVDWDTHRNNLCRKYSIYSPRSFLSPMSHKDEGRDKLFFLSDPARIRSLENAFAEFLFLRATRRLDLFSQCTFQTPTLIVLQGNILKNSFAHKSKGLPGAFRTWDSILSNYREIVVPFVAEGDVLVKELVQNKLITLRSQAEDFAKVREIFDATDHQSKTDWLERLTDVITLMLRKVAANSIGGQEKFTEREEQIGDIFPSFWSIPETDQTEKIAFAHLFRNLGAGIRINLLEMILPAFREFRQENAYSVAVRVYSQETLMEILARGNRKLHPEEESFLLGFINRLMAEFRSTLPRTFERTVQSDKHPFHLGYEEAIKAVIAVDEVSDFTLLDIDCIVSLKHPTIHSVTFCGDLMQRMTSGGLRNWANLDSILSRRIATTGSYCQVIPLETSYRQSQSVLDVARALYKDQQGREAPFVSHNERSAFEPRPKLLVEPDESTRVTWLAEYIKGITEDYSEGVLPTIAVIVKDDSAVLDLKDALQLEDAINDCGLFIDGCTGGSGIGRPSSVRIFSVEFIKGLEFESVIFHDIDTLDSSTSRDLIGKYLYVGISRAAYHLALTSSKELPKSLECINHLLDRVELEEVL